jgi:drug/metabolite transporter (DMT)-like permease
VIHTLRASCANVLFPMSRAAAAARSSAMSRGSWLAAAAALAFGASTPFIQRAGQGLGPFFTAALLYAGAALATAGASRDRSREAPVRRAAIPRLLAVAACGAVLAPTALAFGLQRTGAATASLLLNLEAVFTAALAWVAYREPVGGRVVLALLAMTAGGSVLVASGAVASTWIGPCAILAATLGWALDNTLTRPLADVNPAEVVRYKGLLGASTSLALGLAFGESRPTAFAALRLLACGPTGYARSARRARGPSSPWVRSSAPRSRGRSAIARAPQSPSAPARSSAWGSTSTSPSGTSTSTPTPRSRTSTPTATTTITTITATTRRSRASTATLMATSP